MAALSLAGPAVRELLAGWLPGQRWWPAKGRAVALEPVGRLPLPPAEAEAEVEIEVLFLATGAPPGQVVQVPLTSRPAPQPELAGALVGRLGDAPDGVRWIYDGAHDPTFVAAWVRLLAEQQEIRWNRVMARGVRRREGHGAAAGAAGAAGRPSRVLQGEQSNTSIILDTDGGDAVIVKLFRVLRPGENPDVAVTVALAAGGCDRVPRPLGWVEGGWPDPAGDTVLRGHLAYACEFLTGSEDGWRVASRAVATGASFAAEAAGIGTATAEVHATLAAVLPTVPTSRTRLRTLADQLSGRLRWAVSTTPKLTELQPAAEALFARVRHLPADPARTPVWQRIHGDYHLGQVLHSPVRGWVLIDFEGEPLTPLAERSRPELALRDVAGMLRSFDYAAQHQTDDLPRGDPAVAAAREWARECRTEFLRAYRAVAHAAGGPPEQWENVLLRAFEVDKALYEVVYETWNRPHWVARPLEALRRLLADPST
ncbi:MAG TPA: hypothetical protein VFR67_29590 [Pilimelia sp.]|nr:hypothetical protein [Pilimelia sp.]